MITSSNTVCTKVYDGASDTEASIYTDNTIQFQVNSGHINADVRQCTTTLEAPITAVRGLTLSLSLSLSFTLSFPSTVNANIWNSTTREGGMQQTAIAFSTQSVVHCP